jgi:hypothetical protein
MKNLKRISIYKILGLALIAGVAVVNFTIGQKDYNHSGFSNVTLKNIVALATESKESWKDKNCTASTNEWCRQDIGINSVTYHAHLKNK